MNDYKIDFKHAETVKIRVLEDKMWVTASDVVSAIKLLKEEIGRDITILNVTKL